MAAVVFETGPATHQQLLPTTTAGDRGRSQWITPAARIKLMHRISLETAEERGESQTLSPDEADIISLGGKPVERFSPFHIPLRASSL